MQDLTEVLNDLVPVSELLVETWERMPEAVLAGERERLRVRFLDIGARLLALSEIEGTV